MKQTELQLPEGWKRSAAVGEFKETELGIEQVQKSIESQTKGFGLITVPKFPDIAMPFVPTGSDGNGPVYALMSGTQRAGIELVFMAD